MAIGLSVALAAAVALWFLMRSHLRDNAAPPAVTAPQGSTATFTVRPDEHSLPAGTMGSYAVALGPSYDITSSLPVTGATVSFPVVASDLDPVDGYRPSTTNLFIAVYEPKLATWVPLPTRYDATAKTISATAPHFTSYRKMLTDGKKKVTAKLARAGDAIVHDATTGADYLKDQFVTGVDEFKQLIVDSAQQFWHGMGEFTGGGQETAPCEHPDSDYQITVASDADKFPGCLHSADGNPLLEVENHWLLPFGLKVPDFAHPQAPYSRYEKLVDMIAGTYYKGLHGVYLPAHNYGTASLDSTGTFTASLHFDTFAFAVSTILAALALIPGEQEFTEITPAFKEGVLPVLQADGPTSVHGLFLDWEEVIRKGPAAPTEIDFLGKMNDAISCLQGSYNAAGDLIREPGSLDDALQTSASAALKCASAAVDALFAGGPAVASGSGEGRHSQVAVLLAGGQDLIGALRGIWQATFAGPHIIVIPMTVTDRSTLDVMAAAKKALVGDRPVQKETANTITSNGTTFTITCNGNTHLKTGQATLCDWSANVADPGLVAIRALDGTPPKAETVYMDGDFGAACDFPWALALVHAHGDHPPC